MGLFGTLLRTAIHTVTIPLDVAADVITMGGVNTDKDDPYTIEKLKKIKKDFADLEEDVDDL